MKNVLALRYFYVTVSGNIKVLRDFPWETFCALRSFIVNGWWKLKYHKKYLTSNYLQTCFFFSSSTQCSLSWWAFSDSWLHSCCLSSCLPSDALLASTIVLFLSSVTLTVTLIGSLSFLLSLGCGFSLSIANANSPTTLESSSSSSTFSFDSTDSILELRDPKCQWYQCYINSKWYIKS